MIYPLPAALVTCGSNPEEWNMLTVAWTGTICSDPAMCYISVRPERHSYPIIRERMEFTINLTTAAMAKATDWAGVRSGKDYDKWQETGLTPSWRKSLIANHRRISPFYRVSRKDHNVTWQPRHVYR